MQITIEGVFFHYEVKNDDIAARNHLEVKVAWLRY